MHFKTSALSWGEGFGSGGVASCNTNYYKEM